MQNGIVPLDSERIYGSKQIVFYAFVIVIVIVNVNVNVNVTQLAAVLS